jgi:hypothetical protein
MSDLNTDPLENESKTCSKCELELPLAQFNADSRRKDGKRASCKSCDAAQKKRIRENNLEEYRRRNAENNRKYRASLKIKEDTP